MEISVQLFDRICRVCHIQSGELKSLFTKVDGVDRNLFEILSFTANIDIKIEDRLPKQVCGACETIMFKADAFKRRCQESETILNNVYQNAAGFGKLANIVEEYPSREEKLDYKQKLSEYGTFMSPIPTNSDLKNSFEDKNLLLEDFSVSSTNETRFHTLSDSKILGKREQEVKEEAVTNYDEENSFVDDFDDGGSFEITPKEETEKSEVKVESKKLEVRFQCYCGTLFQSKNDYKTHLKHKLCNSLKSKLECTNCDQEFNSLSAWRVHQQTHRNSNDKTELFQCSLCLRKFKNKMSLATHIQRHEVTDNIKHVCKVCKREFKYKAYLENHILTTHSRSNGFACDICAQNFLNKEMLETHKTTHENEKKYRCTMCSKAFSMLCTLKEHMRTHTGEKPFLCSECGKGFSQKTNLAQHMRRHQGLKPFKCKNCEKGFVSKGELDAHYRKHSGAHPFVCDECGNGFTTSSALVKHRRVHSGERPYACDLCPMRFAASGTLKNHRRTHTGERPFQCSYCEKAFVQRNDLISHIRCHTGERPYVCTQCGQSFRKTSGLKTHVKMHIKDPVVGINALLTSMHCNTEQ